MATHEWIETRDGVYVAQGGVTFGADPFEVWGFKTLNHETGHTFCLQDYYHIGATNLPTEYYVGGWSAMGLIGGVAPDFFAWDKWRLGWLSDSNFDCVSTRGTSEQVLSDYVGTCGGQM
jgi:M6 family metalloprotease-like protein